MLRTRWLVGSDQEMFRIIRYQYGSYSYKPIHRHHLQPVMASGASVSIDSQSLMVGSPNTDINGVTDVGAAYLYNLSNGTLRGGMSNPTPNAGDNFGATTGLLGVKSIVGAPFDDANGSDQGNVYIFTRVAPFGIGLSSNAITENNSLNAVVGNLTASAAANAPVIFALVNGTGGADNASFTISGNQLKANTVFNYEVKSSYSIPCPRYRCSGIQSPIDFRSQRAKRE